jgi:hypothetical protein
MRKSHILIISFALLFATTTWAGSLDYLITMNTSSIDGTNGSLDFALYPGAGTDLTLTATVSNFITDTGAYGGTQTLTGNAAGGPVTSGGTLTLFDNAVSQDNDDLETFTYGNTLSFLVVLSGNAVDAPDGLGTSPNEFDFYTYSDAAGTVPVLTSDATGISGTIDVSPEGVAGTTAVSGDLTISPEPEPIWLFAGALGFAGAGLVLRRIRAENSR